MSTAAHPPVQVIVPGFPPPVLDYVTSQFFGSPPVKPPAEQVPTYRFKLKKMDSGPLGLRSITSPVGYHPDTGRFDADSSKWSFDMPAPAVAHVPSASRR